jgi:flavodoxin
MKILVAFYSKTGKTKTVAQELAKNLKADIEEIIDLKDRSGIRGWLESGRDGMKGYLTEIKDVNKNPKNYDLVIVGTPVWGWNSTPAIRTYLTKYKNDFNKIVIFTTSGGTDPEKTVTGLKTVLEGKKILDFEGWNDTDFKDKEKYQEKLTRFGERIENLK